MPFFGAHLPEVIAVVVVALLFFGPKRLPELGSSIGKTIKEFKQGMQQVSTPDDEVAALPAPSQLAGSSEQPTSEA